MHIEKDHHQEPLPIEKDKWLVRLDIIRKVIHHTRPQVWIPPKCKWKKKTPRILILKEEKDLYGWLVVPFGLCNAPTNFIHLMNDVLQP